MRLLTYVIVGVKPDVHVTSPQSQQPVHRASHDPVAAQHHKTIGSFPDQLKVVYSHFMGVLRGVTLLTRDYGRTVLTCLRCRMSPQHPYSGSNSGHDRHVR